MTTELGPAEVERLFVLHERSNAFETLIEWTYRRLLHEGDIAIDGGAHGGLHTVPMSKLVGPHGQVLAFEPLPEICSWLREVCRRLSNVSIYEEALSDRAGWATFYRAVKEPALSGLRARPIPNIQFSEFRAKLRMLNSLSTLPVSFMKLDLEGGDFHALLGGVSLLATHHPVVIFENGRGEAARDFGYTSEQFFAFFGRIDYCVLDLFGRGFGPAEFAEPWNSRLVPHYSVAAPTAMREAVAATCLASARELLDSNQD